MFSIFFSTTISLPDSDGALLELFSQNAELIKDAVTGCLLGDGSLGFSNDRSANARFSFAQSITHSGYLFYVYLILINLTLSTP